MLLPDFRTARVLVAGDLMLDRYWHGPAARISPEAPVPVVRVKGIEERLGGAGNVALNIAALGGDAAVVGYCGCDEAGDRLLALLDKAQIRCLVQRLPGVPTITKLRVVSQHQQLIRLDFEEPLGTVPSQPMIDEFERRLSWADAVVLSDYGKGTLASVRDLIDRAKFRGKTILVDPKGTDFDRYRYADLITPNLAEFEAVVGPCRGEAEIEAAGARLIERLDLRALLVTRGEHGMTLLYRDGRSLHLPARAKEVFDVTGAGDTVISTLATAMAAGVSLEDAVALANLAAGVVVGKLGTATVSSDELAAVLRVPRAYHRGVVAPEDLLAALQTSRERGEKIVATNGCFDILHRGHLDYLQQARALGDRLIVLVNGDDSVRRLKGPERPVNSLDDRMAMLAALECVDWVVPFHEDTPRELICRILPDILVKGGDYTDVSRIAGHDCVLAAGGEVRLLSFTDGYSTSGVIASIRGDR
ncbi:MAG: bifunctional D-glycero-beta-D-manno-heptose-7-phosphate kinase/D-glycero-beta-D-manno-heptose 1-phosphate adenylyltransferase HldE [Methylococcaceae bacterium]|nr:bifunctional D-glycero-beta-D-manno-heptose-7-phosphate kinase/D-glycero-beta-D-manno-heptose 1-phosphate adenylyltransferase HldE [Methylococcaceae bacterium]